MIFKVLYQEDKVRNPKRESTQTLYMEAESAAAARATVENHTPYNIELVQELTGNHLAYEKQSAAFKLTEF